MIQRASARAFCLATAVLLGACAQQAPPIPDTPSPLAWQQHRDTLETISGFTLRGRINDANQGRTADLRWIQLGDGDFTLQLNGPFGIGAVEIEGSAAGVSVRTRDGTQYLSDPEAWMQANLGWSIPIRDLRHWTLGLPAPGPLDNLSVDTEGQLQGLRQNGWDIRYDSYQTVGQLQLPRKLEARTDQARLRLLIDQWEHLELGPNRRS
ncbi:outer membrane lipoprotein LolB [Sinimarinibacterium sp. CAU 1509]|uniref:lipoprotein insertase outer membrane protein LolB n=1 Tax=Sinimarinibacterium sp. CAU 1509 TaxID=2562283 RepID=UPI0010AB5BF4|nr:lipoprotein insertase outer membrane protein LolB [Sinimarinibacterium sp. CAU 1509]TJY61871.1 outer membrane lipoprotein LolB [Sinimarinibacterium sp. CAU 1509]